MPNQPFADCIAEALDAWLYAKSTPSAWLDQNIRQTREQFDALAMLLDCPYMPLFNVVAVVVKRALAGERIADHAMSNPESRSTADEDIIFQAWVTMIKAHDPAAIMAMQMETHFIAGLLHNNRWKTLVETADGSYMLATLLSRYLSRTGRAILMAASDIKMRHKVKIHLHSMLGEWLAPTIVSDEFTLHDFASALFGDAWCTFVLAGENTGGALAQLIETTRPPFIPGRLCNGDAPSTLHLPEMEQSQ